MNPANFQNMQAQAMPPQPATQPATSSNNAAHVQQFIMHNLQQQAPIQGWQSGVQIQTRGNIVIQIFSQLRLLKSQLDLQYQLQLALGFEAKAFADSPDRSVYESTCRRKLHDIHEMRTKQSAGVQQQMNMQMSMQMNMPQQMQSMAQNPPQGPGPAQFQQGPPNIQQQQMMQLHGLPMQQQSQLPPQNVPMRQPQPNISQAQSSAAPQQMVQHPNQITPTAEDNRIITDMANRMYAQTPPPRMEVIQNNLSNMDPKTRENLARQGVDPLAWFFRTQAMKRFMEIKRTQAGNHGLPTPQPTSIMNGVPRPMSGGPTQQPMPNPQQNFEPPFDHIFGQQQDGLRSQEAGQIVVPASNPQANIDQHNATRANAQQPMNMQNGASRGLQNVPVNQPQAQPFWNPQAGQRNMNQGAAINANGATNLTATGQAPANVFQGQPGGLDNQITRTPSQQTGMPNLNKAAPPGQAPNMWSQRTPQTNQSKSQPNSMPSQAPQQTMERADNSQQRPSMFQNLPPHLQQHLRNMPEDQRRNFMLGLQQRRMEEQQQRQHQQQLQQNVQQQQKMANVRAVMHESFPMSSQPSQPGLQTGPTGPMPNQNMSVQKSLQQSGNAQHPPFPQPNAAMGGSTRQQPDTGQRPAQQRGPLQHEGPLTDEQVRQMDKKLFPANMLSQTNQLAPPKDVRTWGQLKDWAAQNAQTLPAATLEKLKNLQAIQYKALLEGSRSTQPGAVPAASSQPQAPFAQMVSQPNSQAPVPAPQLTNRINVPAPSYQEIQNFRAGLASHRQNVTDEQIRSYMMRNRQQELIKRLQAQQAQNIQVTNDIPKAAQPQNQGQGLVDQSDTTQDNQKGQVKGTVQQESKVPGPATNKSKLGQANRGTPNTKQQQKGTKRSSQDDVVEISNPNLANNQTGPQAHSTVQASKQQNSIGSSGQKVQADSKSSEDVKGSSEPQNGDAPGLGPKSLRNLPQQEVDRRDARLKQLMTEIGQNHQARRPVQMTPQVRAEMSQKLRELVPMVSRMEISLPTLFRHTPDENLARQMIQTRHIIKAQYRDNKFNLVDHFTITQAELEVAYTRVAEYFSYVMSKLGNKPKPVPQSGEQAPNQRQSQHPIPSQEKPPLNAANLQEQQNIIKAQRAVAMQRHSSGYGSRAPAAPTSEKPPPFPPSLGPQSPHGNPLHYGRTTLTADKLVLPQSKRRKSNNQQPSAGSTPVPANSTPVTKSSPLGPKQNLSEVQKAPMPQLSFKCGVSECPTGQKGFATQSELEQHNADVHEPEEPIIDDPAAFALESVRLALGLDENGKIKRQQTGLEAPKMKPSSSAQSYTSMRREASSNLLKTPQASSGIRSPAMDGGKDTNLQGPAISHKESTPPPIDPWAGSFIRPEAIVSAFSPLANMNGMSFTSLQKGLTPSSTNSSGYEKSEKNSPRTSDISENDAVKISIDVKKDKDTDNFDPSEWFEESLYNDIEGMNFDSPDPWLQDDDLDIFAGIGDNQLVDIGPSTGRGKKKDERDFVSEEWLKVYAPERLPAKKVK